MRSKASLWVDQVGTLSRNRGLAKEKHGTAHYNWWPSVTERAANECLRACAGGYNSSAILKSQPPPARVPVVAVVVSQSGLFSISIRQWTADASRRSSLTTFARCSTLRETTLIASFD